MNANPSNHTRPTALEAQAHAEVGRQFAKHLSQLRPIQEAIRHIEENLSRMAYDLQFATSRTSPSRTRIQTDAGAPWYQAVEVMENCWACYRTTEAGIEFGLVESPGPGNAPDVLAEGRDPVEVLQTFARQQREALNLWTEDLTAQVNEFLAEKYPGREMSDVIERFRQGLADLVSDDETVAKAQRQRHSRGITN